MQGPRYEYKMFLALVKVPYCLCAVCWHTMWLHERKWNLEIQEQNEQNTKEMNYDEMECKWKNTRKFWNQVKVFKWNKMIWGTVKSFKAFQNDTYWNFKIKERSEPQRQEKNYDEICSGAQHMVIARSKVWREQCWGTAVLHLADLLQLQCPGALGFVVFSNLSRAVKSAFSEAEVPSLWVLPRGKVWREQWWCSALGFFAVKWTGMCQDDTHWTHAIPFPFMKWNLLTREGG